MKTQLLLPYRFKNLGWILLVPFAIAGIYLHIADYEPNWITTRVFAIYHDTLFNKDKNFAFIETNITSTIVGIGFLIGCLLVAFSKESVEDEYICIYRLKSVPYSG